MKKKLTTLLIVFVAATIGAIFLGMGLAAGNPQAQTLDVLSTQYIGARVPPEVEINFASFAPNLFKTDSIANAQEIVRTGMFLQDAERLPVKVTVAQFSGNREIAPFDMVEDLPVRIVVFDDYPAATRGPERTVGQFEEPRYTVILDDETGDLVYSILTWSHK